MIYTPLTRKALQLMYAAHHGQVDKAGVPYCFHPYEVASHCTSELSVCVALLHDVVEDTPTTFGRLSLEFPPEVVQAVKLLTHEAGIPYMEYIKTVAQNPLAREVKIQDLRHNMRHDRVDTVTPKDIQRYEKYSQALLYLQGITPN